MDGNQESEETRRLIISESGPPPVLPLKTKLAFGVGGCVTALTSTVIGFYASPFLLEVAQLPAAYVSAILMLARIWDAIGDPTVGYLITRTNLKWGRLRPWIRIAAPVCLLAYFCIWLVPDTTSLGGKFFYYLVMFIIFQTGFASYQVPFTSLTMHLSDEPKQRDSATAIRMAFECVSVLFASVVQGSIITRMSSSGAPCADCKNNSQIVKNEPLEKAYVIGGAIMTLIGLVAAFCVYTGVKEQLNRTQHHLSFFQGLKLVVKNKTYMILLCMFLWVWLSSGINQTNNYLFAKYVINREDQFEIMLAILMSSTFLFMPLYFILMAKLGKRTTYLIGVIIFIPSLFTSYIMPADISNGALYGIQVLAGCGVASVYLLPWSMLPDVIDASELKNGDRYESIYYSFFVFFQKFGTGIAIGASTLSLQFAGFISSPCCTADNKPEPQPDSVASTLRILSGLVTACISSIALIFIWFYPLSTEVVQENKRLLAIRRGETQENLAASRAHKSIDDAGTKYGTSESTA